MAVGCPDTSCLIHLERIDRLDLLRALYADLRIPPAVRDEFGRVPDGIEVVPASSPALIRLLSPHCRLRPAKRPNVARGFRSPATAWRPPRPASGCPAALRLAPQAVGGARRAGAGDLGYSATCAPGPPSRVSRRPRRDAAPAQSGPQRGGTPSTRRWTAGRRSCLHRAAPGPCRRGRNPPPSRGS